jgi:hypothetical protein
MVVENSLASCFGEMDDTLFLSCVYIHYAPLLEACSLAAALEQVSPFYIPPATIQLPSEAPPGCSNLPLFNFES